MGRENWQGGSREHDQHSNDARPCKQTKVMLVCLLRAGCLSENHAEAPGS